jgi:hypothetical protein
MTAGIYAVRSNLSVCILEKEICGGLVNWTHTIENFPSYSSIHPFSGKVFANHLILLSFQAFRNMCSHRKKPIEKFIRPNIAYK